MSEGSVITFGSPKKNPNLVKEYWDASTLDYIWIALTTHVLPEVAVEIWQVLDSKERRPVMLQRYPEEEGGRVRLVLRVLRSNPNIAPHYDLLV